MRHAANAACLGAGIATPRPLLAPLHAAAASLLSSSRTQRVPLSQHLNDFLQHVTSYSNQPLQYPVRHVVYLSCCT